MRRMKFLSSILLALSLLAGVAADFKPAPQHFRQEIARAFTSKDGLPNEKAQLIDCADGFCRVFVAGHWHELRQDRWEENAKLAPGGEQEFAFADAKGQPVVVPVPWREVRQMVRSNGKNYLARTSDILA